MTKVSRFHVTLASLATILLSAACGGPAATRPARATAPRVAPAPAPAPRAEVAPPTLFVTLETIADRSPASASKAQRAERAAAMRALLTDDLGSAPTITLADDEARALGLARYTVDATIEKLDHRVRGSSVEIACELRVAVTDGRGKMLFFLTNAAAVRVPADGFRREFVAPLQRDALEGAARELNEDLISRLTAEALTQSSPAVAVVH